MQDLWEKNQKLVGDLTASEERVKAAKAEMENVKKFTQEVHCKLLLN
jgi:hypothetical protein